MDSAWLRVHILLQTATVAIQQGAALLQLAMSYKPHQSVAGSSDSLLPWQRKDWHGSHCSGAVMHAAQYSVAMVTVQLISSNLGTLSKTQRNLGTLSKTALLSARELCLLYTWMLKLQAVI